MTEELGAISVGLQVSLGTLDKDLARIKKQIEPIEREHKIPFAVGKVSFAQVQKEIEALTKKQIPVQLMAAPGSGRAIHQQLTAQLKAAGPIPVRIKANLSATEIQRIRTEITKAISKTPIPLRFSAVGGPGGSTPPAVPAAPAPAAGRARPQAPVVASAPAAAAPAAPRRSTAPRTTTASPTPAASPTAAAPTPAQPTPPAAARASTRASQPAPKTAAKSTKPAAAKPAAAPQPAAPTTGSTEAVSSDGGHTWETARAQGRIVDLTKGDELPLPRTREARRFRRRADPHYGEQFVETESAKLRDLRSQRLKAETPEDKRRLSDAVRKQKGVVERAQRMAGGGTVDTMSDEEREAARERWERRAAQAKVGRSSPISYGDLSNVHPALRRQLEAMQMGRIYPVLADAFDALQSGDMPMARGVLQGLGLEFRGASGTRKRRRFGKLFSNPDKATEEQLLQHSALGALFSEVRNALDPNAVNLPSADYHPSSKKGKGGVEPRSTADADLAAANRGEMTFEELQARHPEFASLGIPGTPWVPKTAVAGPAPRRRKAKFGPIVKGRVRPSKPINPDAMPGNYKPEQWTEEKIGGYPEPPRIWTPPPMDLVAHDKDRVAEALESAIKDAIEGSTPASKAQLSKLQKRFTKRAGGGPIPVKAGGLAARLMARGYELPAETVIVGEGGEEAIVPGDNGMGHVIDNAGQNVPMWMRRAKDGKGFGKDLTHRVGGGGFKGKLAAEPGSGLRGRKQFREGFAGEREAIATGLLSPQGGVQRVFVTNWPAGGGGRGPMMIDPSGAYGMAAGPMRMGRGRGPASADEVGEALKKILGGKTEKMVPKEEKTDTRIAPLSPEEKVEAKLEAIGGESPRALRQRLTNIRSGLSETQSQSPVRSLAPAFGQIVATRFGRGELLKRLADARDLTSQATRAEGLYNAEVQKQVGLQTQLDKEEDPDKKAKLVTAIEEQGKATAKAKDYLSGMVTEAESAAKSADALSLKFGTLVGNTVGIIGGTLAFGATLGVAQAGLSAIAQVASPAIERLTGFTATSAAVTSALGEQIKAQNGAAKSAFAMTAAQAGLSDQTANAIGPLLQQRATTEQNNKTLQSGIDLLHSFEEAKRRGGDQGLFGTTGGVFGSIINGTASTQELIKKELNDASAGTVGLGDVRGIGKNPFGETYAGASIQEGYRSAAVLAAKEAQKKGQTEVEVQTAPFGRGTFKVADILSGFNLLDDRITFFNDALKAGGSNLKFLAGVSEETAQSFAGAAVRAGATELADTATGPNKVVLVDQNGQPVLDKDRIRGALGAINQSTQTPDPALLIKQLTERIIPAQKALFRAQSGFQRNVLNPGQFALGELANPTPGTQGIGFDAGLVGKGDTVGQKAADKYRKIVGGAVEDVNAQIAAGREALINLVPADTRQTFTGLLGQIESLGKKISGIQLGIQQQQVNLQVAEYNNQLRIARRSLADARDLQAGLNGETRNTLGGMEAQNIVLQRRLQLMQFELQQRQINFRLATAGFVTPGSTPEEIAARIKEAKIEAEYAQKQLDIQKQLAANQYKTVQITADRNVTDLLAQISLLEQGKKVTVDTAAASRALDILNKKQQRLVEEAGTYIEEGAKITSAAMSAASDVMAQTGKGFQFLLGETAKAWGIFGEQAQLILSALKGSAPSGGTTDRTLIEREKKLGEDLNGNGRIGAASGFLGNVSKPTDFTVGEVKGETVAVLRNPRIVPNGSVASVGGGGGSPVSIQIIVTGNTFGKKDDIDDLVDRLKGEVLDEIEERFHRKASLLLR